MFVNPLPGVADLRLIELCRRAWNGGFANPIIATSITVVYALLLIVPAAMCGWMLQAFLLIVCGTRLIRLPDSLLTSQTDDYDEDKQLKSDRVPKNQSQISN